MQNLCFLMSFSLARSALAGAVLVLGVVATPATAYDSMYPTANTGWSCGAAQRHCQTDNSALTVHKYSSLSPAGKNNVDSTLFGSYDTTDLNVTLDPTPVLTGSAETDILYRADAGAMPDASTLGTAYCDDNVSASVCDQHYVTFRHDYPKISLACHETGHAVGLSHGANANPVQPNDEYTLRCMRQPASIDDPWLGPNNANQIDATY